MPRMKRVTVSGAVLEQEIFNVAPNTKNVKGAVPKPLTERTAEEKEKYNLKIIKKFKNKYIEVSDGSSTKKIVDFIINCAQK